METEVGHDNRGREIEEEGSRLLLQDWIRKSQLLELV